MDLPVRKKLPHTIPQWVAEGSWFFITINCVPPGKNQLCRADTGDAVLAAMSFNHERFVWHCRLCLLMPDHLHAIMAFPREPGMATTIKNWKKFVAGKHGIDWQRDFFDHRLQAKHHDCEETCTYGLTASHVEHTSRRIVCRHPVGDAFNDTLRAACAWYSEAATGFASPLLACAATARRQDCLRHVHVGKRTQLELFQ